MDEYIKPGKNAAGGEAQAAQANAKVLVNRQDAKVIANRHIKLMYRNVCRGIAVVAALLPIVLFAFSEFCSTAALPGTRSASPGSFSSFYNYACSPNVEFYNGWGRTWFVGTLLIVGTFLILFPAYTRFQLWLKVSGVLAILVALFPTGTHEKSWAELGYGWVQTVHGASAITLFIPIVLLAIFDRFGTYHLIVEKSLRERLVYQYRAAGFVFVAGAVAALRLGGDRRIFWLEVVGVYGFAIYWWTRAAEVWALAEQ